MYPTTPLPGSDAWRAPTLQQPSNFRALSKTGQVLYGVLLCYPSVHVAKTIAVTGADWCWIDTEHVAYSPSLLVELIQVIIHESGGKMIPIVRVPNKTAFEYMIWCLDAGAGGIIIPHVETAEEVAAIVAACRYPPLGHRGLSPATFIPGITDTTPAGETIYSIANKHVAIIPQIESLAAVKNADAIMGNEQVDMVMIGNRDLRMDMGLFGLTGNEPEYLEANAHVVSVAKSYNLPLMCFTSDEDSLRARHREGFKLFMVTMDLLTLAYGTVANLKRAREVIAGVAE
ncbi:Pyruvate/Phosphoenolpyruvate kinase-like domain-containing protein [Mycena belliarum]|uniref:Pyruvate/Phosphoenolpyruvate kinase-like domain-containing protein n=1 Tax=Mycena belliarum TaxID=1033014 RepID=A0AAD6UN76_9AGAR|nr:Pyruvate/Phosphoenolpyruvate kinase-like domain-containing protein [Mycena belliae]